MLVCDGPLVPLVTAALRSAGLLLLLAAACTPSPRASSSPASGEEQAETQRDPASGEEQAETQHDPASAPCDPLPNVGDPCDGKTPYCVADWGEPGGWSTALWCRDGHWQIEEEKNL